LPEHLEIKRSSSATSISSKASEEALEIAGGHQSNKEQVIEEQRGILQNIKDKQTSKLENETDGTRETSNMQHTDDPMDFHDEHFKRSPYLNSEPSRIQAGQSTFYPQLENLYTTSPVETVQDRGHSSYHLRDS
jgi:hypothetical protein